MNKTANLLAALAIAAITLPVAAADEAKKPAAEAVPYKTGDERPTAAPSKMTPEQKAADKSKKRASGKDAQVYDIPKAPAKGAKMSAEEKAADKAAKRTGAPKAEQEKAAAEQAEKPPSRIATHHEHQRIACDHRQQRRAQSVRALQCAAGARASRDQQGQGRGYGQSDCFQEYRGEQNRVAVERQSGNPGLHVGDRLRATL